MNKTIGEETAENRKWFERGRQSAIEECLGVVPEKRPYNVENGAERFEGLSDKWGKEYAMSVNDKVDGHNQCRTQTLAAIEGLIKKTV